MPIPLKYATDGDVLMNFVYWRFSRHSDRWAATNAAEFPESTNQGIQRRTRAHIGTRPYRL